MDWHKRCKNKIVSADEAVRAVKSGDRVAISVEPQPTVLMKALAERKEALENVHIFTHSPHFDPGWLQPCWDESFPVTVMMYLGEVARASYDQKLIDYWPMVFSHQFKSFEEAHRSSNELDVLMAVCSPPDEHGFCSFGHSLWDKRRWAQNSRKVLAQIDEGMIRTYGTNYLHVDDINYMVDYSPPAMSEQDAGQLIGQVSDSGVQQELRRILPFMSPYQRAEILPQLCKESLRDVKEYARTWGWVEPPEDAKKIAGFVAELIKDGDTIQIGVGTPSGFMPKLGVFDHRKNLGWHAEMGAPGILDLVQKGVIDGSRKTINKGKAIFTGLYGLTSREIEYAHMNPLVEQHDSDYVVNISTVAAHENYVAINNSISVDLSGQINSETIFGPRLWNGTGGQPELHMGAVLSKGGRAIILLRSTAQKGTVSRIVPQLEEGSVVTIPRTFADIIVTEYGVAKLLGKSLRERARELINIAHPDFRPDLKKAADKLLYP